MHYNSYTLIYEELLRDTQKLTFEKEKIIKDLVWYANNNIENLVNSLDWAQVEIDSEEEIKQSIEKNILLSATDLSILKLSAMSRMNPKSWFLNEQKEIRLAIKNIEKKIKDLEIDKQSTNQIINEINIKIKGIKNEINNYQEFDLKLKMRNYSEIEKNLVFYEKNLEEALIIKKRVDVALSPIVSKIEELNRDKLTAEKVLTDAQNFDNRLNNTENSYERAMVHESCEVLLGNSKPKQIINKQERIIKGIERNILKCQERAKEIEQKAARIIDTIIIDGNNMCYESGKKIIGIKALQKVVPELAKDRKLIIVFDASIRKILKKNDKQIKNSFDDDIKIHIVASKTSADETILDLASTNENFYIIANDRYTDYPNKEVVKKGRLIRHEIVDGHIFIHDLGVRASY